LVLSICLSFQSFLTDVYLLVPLISHMA
jgi:hypothetical protein